MTETSEPDSVQAVYNAVRAYMDRVAETYVADRAEVVDAFDGVLLWGIRAEDVDALVDRMGMRVARPFLCALWESGEVDELARMRAMSVLLSPRSVDTNPLVEFLLELDAYDRGVPARWVLDNRPAIRTVWVTLRHKPRDHSLRGIRALSRVSVLTLVMRYAGSGVPLDLPRLAETCEALARTQHTLIYAGVPVRYAHAEMGRAGVDRRRGVRDGDLP